MITKARAREIRSFIEQMATSIDDSDALEHIEVFPLWRTGKEYTAQTDRVRYEGLLYRCEQSHTSQSDYTPDVAVSLWTRIDDPSEEFPEWRQPTGATDAYDYGSKVSHNNKHWISIFEGKNVWEPGVYGWEEVE